MKKTTICKALYNYYAKKDYMYNGYTDIFSNWRRTDLC